MFNLCHRFSWVLKFTLVRKWSLKSFSKVIPDILVFLHNNLISHMEQVSPQELIQRAIQLPSKHLCEMVCSKEIQLCLNLFSLPNGRKKQDLKTVTTTFKNAVSWFLKYMIGLSWVNFMSRITFTILSFAVDDWN